MTPNILHSRIFLPQLYPGRYAYSVIPGNSPNPRPSLEPLITQKDLDLYLPRLQMSGWEFHQTSKRLDKLGHDATWWELYRATRFPSFRLAMGYVNNLADIAKSEKHHPTILIYNRVNVDISLATHDTVERAAVSSAGHTVTARWPGLTVRDLRMATLINPLLLKHGAILDPVPPTFHTPTLPELLSVRVTSD